MHRCDFGKQHHRESSVKLQIQILSTSPNKCCRFTLQTEIRGTHVIFIPQYQYKSSARKQIHVVSECVGFKVPLDT